MSVRTSSLTASGERHGTPRHCIPEPDALIGHLLWLLKIRRPIAQGHVGCPSPEPAPHWRAGDVQPARCIGRYEGTT